MLRAVVADGIQSMDGCQVIICFVEEVPERNISQAPPFVWTSSIRPTPHGLHNAGKLEMIMNKTRYLSQSGLNRPISASMMVGMPGGDARTWNAIQLWRRN